MFRPLEYFYTKSHMKLFYWLCFRGSNTKTHVYANHSGTYHAECLVYPKFETMSPCLLSIINNPSTEHALNRFTVIGIVYQRNSKHDTC